MENWIPVLIIGLAVAGLLYPTHSVLVVKLSIQPPADTNIQFLKDRQAFIPYFFSQSAQKQTFGDIKVIIEVKDTLNQTVFIETYGLTYGSYTIKTNFAVDSGYTVVVSVPRLNDFKKVATIE